MEKQHAFIDGDNIIVTIPMGKKDPDAMSKCVKDLQQKLKQNIPIHGELFHGSQYEQLKERSNHFDVSLKNVTHFIKKVQEGPNCTVVTIKMLKHLNNKLQVMLGGSDISSKINEDMVQSINNGLCFLSARMYGARAKNNILKPDVIFTFDILFMI